MEKSFAVFSLFSCFLLLIICDSPSIASSNFMAKLEVVHSSQNLSSLYSDSLRDRKDGKTNQSIEDRRYAKIPIFPKKFGALIPLSFGSPPQTLHFIFHTGSALTWFPCGDYSKHKSSVHENKAMFYPSLSSSFKVPECHSFMSQFYLVDKRYIEICQNCEANNSLSCSKPVGYKIAYFQGSTSGILVSENLKFQRKTYSNFFLGCSSLSTFSANGFAGFGRGDLSMPYQIGLHRFSYCISSTQFVDKKNISFLLLNAKKHRNLNYVQFLTSPNKLFHDFYYVIVKYIVVGRTKIEVPVKSMSPGRDGIGGTVIDSGTTFTSMEREIFHSVTREFEAQLGKGTFIDHTDKTRSCFNVSGRNLTILPKLAFQFRSGTLMELQPQNSLIYRERDIVCLSIMAKANVVPKGPAIVLGYTQLLDFRMEFDLDNGMIGFRNVKHCSP